MTDQRTAKERRQKVEAALESVDVDIETGLPFVHLQVDAVMSLLDRFADEDRRAGAAEELRAAAESLVLDGRPDLTTVEEVNAVNQAAQILDNRADELDPR